MYWLSWCLDCNSIIFSLPLPLTRSLLAKVKVTSYLVFPDTIDMSAYTGSSSVIYKLRAVIVHCGPSAYSGHYTVHVRDVKVSMCVHTVVCMVRDQCRGDIEPVAAYG